MQAHAVLGVAALRLGKIPEAQENLYEALHLSAGAGAFVPLMYVIPGAALLLAERGEDERAVELYALASRSSFVANSRWFSDIAGKHISAAAVRTEGASPEALAAAQERGRIRELWATVDELWAEFGGKTNAHNTRSRR